MLKKVLITLLSTVILSTAFLVNSNVVTAEDKNSAYDKNVQNITNEVYLNMEQDTKDYMKIKGYHIQFLKENQNICDMELYKDKIDSSAIIDHTDKRIYISYTKDQYNNKLNLWHEIGHMEDERLNWISSSGDFNQVWNLRYKFFNRNVFPDQAQDGLDYHTSNKKECFAQLYAFCKVEKDFMSKNFPTIYNYFNNL